MTTAHRPTFDTARGGGGRGENDLSKLSTQFSARDMPGHLTLKYRQKGQAHPDEVKEKNLRYDLEEKEKEAHDRKRERDGVAGAIEDSSSSKKPKIEESPGVAEDEDLDVDADTDDDEDEEDSDDDAELMAELERIKKERAAEKARKEAEVREEQERIRQEAMIKGNPLLNLHDEESGQFKVKRRWDDDVVFKNCAKGISERKKEATFINDSIRSEFHRKFMDKYIKSENWLKMEPGQGKRALVFFLTFLSYSLYHASRKNLSGVKASVSNDWLGNDTRNPHIPLFSNENQAKNFLGSLDGLFMIFYAAALFFWGWLGDRWDPKHVAVLGMIGSAVTLTLFGSVPYWLDFYSISFYIFIYILFGILQACGWPNEVTIMANWFPKQNRGAVMGAWASCQPVGNILGALVISAVIPLGYQWTFAVNSILIFLGGLLLHFCINTKPEKSPSRENTGTLIDEENDGNQVADGVEEVNHEPISFWQALLLPNVLAYCLCNACVKMVNYAFFFWLPFYLTHKFGWSEAAANQLAIWYDIGGVIGSIAGGIVSDKLGHRSPIIMIMLVASLFSLFIYSDLGPNKLINVLMMTVLGVTISGPYNLIVGTISVDLGSQPALAGNEKAMSTVTGLIDGTGSAGSAIGQFFVPVIQNAFGWSYVFYMFIVMNFFSAACLSHRFYTDALDVWKNYRRRGSFTVRQRSLEDEPLLSHDED